MPIAYERRLRLAHELTCVRQEVEGKQSAVDIVQLNSNGKVDANGGEATQSALPFDPAVHDLRPRCVRQAWMQHWIAACQTSHR